MVGTAIYSVSFCMLSRHHIQLPEEHLPAPEDASTELSPSLHTNVRLLLLLLSMEDRREDQHCIIYTTT